MWPLDTVASSELTSPRRAPRRRSARWVLGLGLLALALGIPATVSAQGHSVFSLTVDNDEFAVWRANHRRTDRDYSSGVELSVQHPLRPSASGWRRTLLASLSQRIYTPNITLDEPPADDRPYAAILGVSGGLALERGGQRHDLSGTLAVMGPPALGREMQEFFHKVFPSPAPRGWDYQLPFRFGLGVGYNGARRLVAAQDASSSLGFDVAGLWGGELGTLRGAATFGARVTLGLRPPRPWAARGAPESERVGLRLFLIGGAGAEAVGYDVTISHVAADESIELDRRALVPRGEAGIGAEFGGVSVSFVGTVTGQEFVGQPTPHAYGSLRIAVR